MALSKGQQELADAIIAGVAQAIVQAMAPQARPAAAAVGSAAAPLYVADPLSTGKVCRCGHEHSRAVVAAERPRLAHESACRIKGCVSRPNCK
jgi:hypothetical protein